MVMIIAHRGASMLSPENTISAIHSAIYLNCDMVEIDVRRCKTGELVLMHDKNVKRTTNGKGVVKQMPLEELKKLKVGKDGGIPTLDDALSYANGKIKVNIEIKELELVDDVMRLVDKYDMRKEIIISSFLIHSLIEVSQRYPDVKTALLLRRAKRDSFVKAKELKLDAFNISHHFIKKKFIDDAHHEGIKVNVYTVNDIPKIEEMKKLEVDGIITNHPELV